MIPWAQPQWYWQSASECFPVGKLAPHSSISRPTPLPSHGLAPAASCWLCLSAVWCWTDSIQSAHYGKKQLPSVGNNTYSSYNTSELKEADCSSMQLSLVRILYVDHYEYPFPHYTEFFVSVILSKVLILLFCDVHVCLSRLTDGEKLVTTKMQTILGKCWNKACNQICVGFVLCYVHLSVFACSHDSFPEKTLTPCMMNEL